MRVLKLPSFFFICFQISSVQIHNKAMGANIAIAGAMGTTAKTMGNMNKIMNPQEVAKNMEAFKHANAKIDMTDEMSMFFFMLNVLLHFLNITCNIVVYAAICYSCNFRSIKVSLVAMR